MTQTRTLPSMLPPRTPTTADQVRKKKEVNQVRKKKEVPAPAWSWDSPDLTAMTPRGLDVFAEAFQLGYRHGIEEGRRQAHAEVWGDVDDAHAGRELKRLALLPAHADVLDRRGQHEEAARYRAMLRERGLAS